MAGRVHGTLMPQGRRRRWVANDDGDPDPNYLPGQPPLRPTRKMGMYEPHWLLLLILRETHLGTRMELVVASTGPPPLLDPGPAYASFAHL